MVGSASIFYLMSVLDPSAHEKNAQFLPKLGLVCITNSQAVRYKTITRKRFLQLNEGEQVEKLRFLYTENLKRLNLALDFCQTYDLKLYRMTSGLFPFSDTPLGKAILEEFTPELQQTGTRATEAGIRLVLHPNQFVVLNSDNPQVIENSITILGNHAYWFDLLGLPRSSWALMNIHGGKGNRAEKLVEVIRDLPESIKSRLTLENDERTYSSGEIAEICQAAGIAMVFDAHHHLVYEQLPDYNHPSVAEALALARTTWDRPDWQLVHISNGREGLHDLRHSDLITVMPDAFRADLWIEVEAKQKEIAIAKLQQEWLHQ
jgi:UV DNA damage endonuclease